MKNGTLKDLIHDGHDWGCLHGSIGPFCVLSVELVKKEKRDGEFLLQSSKRMSRAPNSDFCFFPDSCVQMAGPHPSTSAN